MNLFSAFNIPFWETENLSHKENFERHQKVSFSIREKLPSRETDWLNSYQSPPNALVEEEGLYDIVERTFQLCSQATADMNFKKNKLFIQDSWINICNKNSILPRTITSKGIFTCLYFINVPENFGDLIIHNPAYNNLWRGNYLLENNNKYTSSSMKVSVKNGQLIVFPSYLEYGFQVSSAEEESIVMTTLFDCVGEQ